MSSNVISLSRHQSVKKNGISALLQSFAQMRRDPNEVFWLKENAEVLNILECSNLERTASRTSVEDIDVYAEFYEELPKRLAFFPQYYRFFLSIACDLEALGIAGDHAQQLSDFVQDRQLVRAEMSDLQRAEAMRLLARRGGKIEDTQQLIERLHRFMNNSSSFALPNRKAAYELTHIVFYLSDYGRRDPMISDDAIQSLMFTGILAHLEQNADLLSEICIALRYAGKIPPTTWENWIKSVNNRYVLRADDPGYSDNYHEFLVSTWACAQMKSSPFSQTFFAAGTGFYSPVNALGAVGQISEILLDWDGPRLGSWDKMERKLADALPDQIAQHLSEVVEATPCFNEFWQHFARATPDHDGANDLLTPHMISVAR